MKIKRNMSKFFKDPFDVFQQGSSKGGMSGAHARV